MFADVSCTSINQSDAFLLLLSHCINSCMPINSDLNTLLLFLIVMFWFIYVIHDVLFFFFGRSQTSLTMIDDCENKWSCITIFGSRPHHHIKLGGGWKRMVDARRIEVGAIVKVGFPHADKNDTIYIYVKRPIVIWETCCFVSLYVHSIGF